MANVPACASTALTDKNQTRLPKNKSEGDIPLIAIATGGSDAVECLLRSVGIDETEFTNDSGTGRIQLFQGYRASPTIMTGGASSALRAIDQLWASVTSMRKYDVVLMACEGDSGQSESRTAAQYAAVRGYADLGGRIFGSHYHNNWIRSEDGEPSAGYPQVVKFASGAHGLDNPVPYPLQIDTSFPKGVAFRDWLVAVGATPTPGTISINDGEHTVDAVIPPLAQQWIYGQDTSRSPTKPVVEYFSLTTPVGSANVCGRMVFSDVHVSQGGGIERRRSLPHPLRRDPDRSDAAAEGAGVHAVRSVVVRADRDRHAGAAAAAADRIDTAPARHHPGAAGAAAPAPAAATAGTRVADRGRPPGSWTAGNTKLDYRSAPDHDRRCAAVRLAGDVEAPQDK